MRRYILPTSLILLLTALAPARAATPALEEDSVRASMPMVDPGIFHAPDLTTDSQPTAPLPPQHELTGIRVRPLDDATRVILRFKNSAPPYDLSESLDTLRIQLNLINARLDYLPAELNQLDDDCLSGIWLTQAAPGLAVLELRLQSSAVHVQHFTLDEPPVVVIDLRRTDLQWTRLGRQTIETKIESRPETESILSPILPGPARPPATTPTQDLAATADSQHDAAGTSTLATAAIHDQVRPTSTSIPVARTDDPYEVQPLDIEYDYFPIHKIYVESPEAQAIVDAFMMRRWALVMRQSLAYLESQPVNKETLYILYLLAEARWQLGFDRIDPPYADIKNFYQQALRTHSSGDLGAFAHWRLAQLAAETVDDANALFHLDKAIYTSSPGLRDRVNVLQAKLLARQDHADEALAVIERRRKHGNLSHELDLELAKLEGAIYLEAGDPEASWQAYQRALDLDPEWMNLDVDGWISMATAAMEAGELATADAYLLEIIQKFGQRDEVDTFKMLLMRAEILERLQLTDEALTEYAKILNIAGQTAKGQALLQQMRERYPDEYLESRQNFCLILWREGRLRESMTELNRIYHQCLAEGIETDELQPIVEKIVPAFLDQAQRLDQPFDVVQAWRLYNHLIEDEAARQGVYAPLSAALEDLGLFEEAYKLVEAIKDSGPPTIPTLLREARLLVKMERPDEALKLLEGLSRARLGEEEQVIVYRLMAQAYETAARPLEAAQAWQSLADASRTDPTVAGEALLRSGRLFLASNLPEQAIEIGLRSLIYEDRWRGLGGVPWSDSVRHGIRFMLAAAYRRQGDAQRVVILMEDLLTNDRLTPLSTAHARMFLGESLLKLDQADQAKAVYQTIIDDAESPETYVNLARQVLRQLDWNREHPNWKISATG